MRAASVTLSDEEAQIVKDALAMQYRGLDSTRLNDRRRTDIDRIFVKINLAFN